MKETIRVLHVIGSMNLAGAETFIMNVYRKINRNNVQFDFIVHKDGKYDDEIKSLGGKIYKIEPLNKCGYWKYCKQLEKIIKENDYKIIHSHINESSGLVLKIAKKCDVPVRISHSHSTGNHSNLIYKIFKIYLRGKINKYATHLFACSKEAAIWLFRKDADRAIIVKNGIDINKFTFSLNNRNEKRKEFEIQDSTILLGNIGRITHVKNQEFLIEIFEEFNKSINDSKLIIVGEGELKEKLKNITKEKNIDDKVIFTGARKDISQLINAFDIFVFPSLYEGLGIALLEAQCNGLLCFASDTVPRAAKVSQNLNFISLKKNSKFWADSIQKIYKKNFKRKDESQKLREAGYDIEEVAERLEKFYINGGKNEKDFTDRHVKFVRRN